MTRFFADYPIIPYRFGDNEAPVLFPNLSVFVQLIDTALDDVTAYETYYVKDGERPDNVSTALYGSPEYYWTFYYVNETIQQQGWPLGNAELLDFAKKVYPYQALTTNRNLQFTAFVGQVIQGSSSGATGIVRKRDLDKGYLFVEPLTSTLFTSLDRQINYVEDEISKVLPITKVEEQYLAAHHYENGSGQYVDIISGFTGTSPNEVILFDTTGLSKISYYERMIKQNENLRFIRILRPDVVGDIVGEYRRLVRK